MVRDLARLGDTPFDILIVGAGIYGATIAWDAAARGLSVAIVDRGDFGGATSFNSLKTVHGGLRSLQRAALGDMREFIRERRALSRIAPHLVHPLPFVIPTYRHPMRNKPLMRVVMAVNDLVAFDRNRQPDPSKHLPPGRVVSREECLRLNPAIAPDGVTGGVVWHDCQMHSADRLTLAFLTSACRAGAAAANHVEATAILAGAGGVAGVRARDAVGGGTFDVRARLVVNAAGPWAWSLLDRLPGELAGRIALEPPSFSKALNLVTRAVGGPAAAGGLVDGRFLFMAPWRDVTVIGTSHDPYAGAPDALSITARDVDAFFAEVTRAFPRAGLERSDVRLVHRGLLPAAPGAGAHEKLLKRSLVIDHRRKGVGGLISVIGVRYTTARATAAAAVDLAFTALGRQAPACPTETTPLAGGDIADFAAFERAAAADPPAGLGPEALRRLTRCYGSDLPAIVRLIDETPALAAPLSPACPVTAAEIVHAARHEMAAHLADAVIRRTDAGSAGHPGAAAVRAAAAVMAAEHGWSAARTADEIADVDRFYEVHE